MKRFQIINSRRSGPMLIATLAVALVLTLSVVFGLGCSKKSTPSPNLPAFIMADADSLQFEAGRSSRTLTLRNTGDQSADFVLSATELWCSFKDTTGTLNAHGTRSINVLVSRAGMAVGTYSSLLRISTDGSPTDSLVVRMGCPSEPLIQASPDTLDFGTSATSLVLTLRNDGNAVGSYSLVSTETWLTTDSPTGSIAAGALKTVTATVSMTGVSAGILTARLLVNTGTATTDTVFVKRIVVPARILASRDARDTITFYCPSSVSDTLTLKNVGATSGTLTLSTLPGWFTISLPTGTFSPQQSRAENLSVNCTSVPTGTTPAAIIVMTNGAATDTINIKAVKVCVSASPPRLDFSATQRRLTVKIRNPCGGTLSWSPSSAQGWISFEIPNDSTLTVIVDPTPLPAGTSSGTVTIDAGDQGSLAIPVTKIVDPRPRLVIDPPALDFQTDKDSLRLLIDNEGGDVLNWSASADSSWLSADPSSGALSRFHQQYVWVRINRGQMPCGAQNLKLHITSNAGTNPNPNPNINVTANGNCFDLRGVVTDAGSEIGLSHALVEILNTGLSEYTNDTGVYIIRRVPIGTQTVKATKGCFTPSQTQVVGHPGTVVTKDLSLLYSGPGTCVYSRNDSLAWWPGHPDTLLLDISEPSAANIRIHFVKAWFPCCTWGHIRVLDCRGGPPHFDQWDPILTDYWTPWLDANCVRLEVSTRDTRHGFIIDKYEYYLK